MALWFEVSLRYDKVLENGAVKKVSEKFLVDSLSLTDAEATTIERTRNRVGGEYSATSAKRTKISEVFLDPSEYADKFYLVKVGFITLDEKSGKEKRSIQQMIVQAGDFHNALAAFEDKMRGTMADFVIVSIAETQYMDVFGYEYGKED